MTLSTYHSVYIQPQSDSSSLAQRKSVVLLWTIIGLSADLLLAELFRNKVLSLGLRGFKKDEILMIIHDRSEVYSVISGGSINKWALIFITLQ